MIRKVRKRLLHLGALLLLTGCPLAPPSGEDFILAIVNESDGPLDSVRVYESYGQFDLRHRALKPGEIVRDTVPLEQLSFAETALLIRAYLPSGDSLRGGLGLAESGDGESGTACIGRLTILISDTIRLRQGVVP